MGNIYSAKFMHEFANTLDSKVFQTPVNETYLFSTISVLNEMNAIIDKNTKKLYNQISEAESKQEENKIFAEYFYQFKSIFNEFSNKLQQMKTRMSMSIENKVETWKDLYEDDSYISNFDRPFTYTGYNFPHIEEGDYPRLNLYKLYQKEFDFIGQLMQDTSLNASPSVRLQIIASVCNNFSAASKDKNWIKNLIHDMIDIDEKEITRSYSECIYNALRDKYEISVDKGMLYTCKESLSDYEDVVDAAAKLCDDLLYELDRVAENISSFLFRNQDNKLKIKTDTDGIIDRDYRLDTYSMNQLDLFMKNKIRQMKKVLNVFAIAVGIKFDTAVDYIEQNIEILKTVKMYDAENTNEPYMDEDEGADTSEQEDFDEPDEDDSDDEDFDGNSDDEGDEHGEDDNHEEEPDEDDFDDDDFEFGSSNSEGEENKEMIEEEPDDVQPEEQPEAAPNDAIDYDSEEFSESYLFEAELFELEMMADEYQMFMSISEAVLLEENPPAGNGGGGNNGGGNQNGGNNGGNQGDGNNGGNNGGNNNSSGNQNNNSNLKKLANKAGDPNWFQKIIAKIKELWEKFKQKFLDKTKEKVEFLKNNKKYIFGKKVKAQAGLKYTPRFNLDAYFKIPDLNYNDANMQKNLDDDDTFVQAYFNDFYKDLSNDDKDLGLADAIKKTILGEAQETTNADQLKTSAEDAYNYCIKHESYVNRINTLMNTLYKAEKVAKDISKVDGATIENDDNNNGGNNGGNTSNNEASYYFMEFDGAKVTKDNTKVNRVKRYFNICARALAAYMTVCDNLFVEMYEYCKWHIQTVRSGGEAASNNQGDGNNGGNQGDGNNGGNQGDGNNGGNQGGNQGQGSSSRSRGRLANAAQRAKNWAKGKVDNAKNKKNNKKNKK